MLRKTLLGLFVLITLGPLLMGLGYSLAYSLGLVGLMNEGLTGQHWARLAATSDLWSTLGYTLYLTLVSVALCLALALAVAWRYLHRPTGGRLYKSLFLPLLVPPLVAAFAWNTVLSPGGLLSRLSYHLGLTAGVADFPRLVNDAQSVGILLTHLFLVFPLFTLLFIEQARKERMAALLHMSLTLGSSRGQFFRRIYAPLILRKSAPVVWLYGIFLFGTYEVPLLLGRSSPRAITVFITEKLTKFNLYDVPVGHAMAVVYSLLVLSLVTLFVRRQTLRLL